MMTYPSANAKTFSPSVRPLQANDDADHPKVKELSDLVIWREGMFWCSPELHGAMTGRMKIQFDWFPLSRGGVRPSQGKTLAVMQVNVGWQNFKTVKQLRILGRWMGCLTIPNWSSTPKALMEFDWAGQMTLSPFHFRMLDAMEDLLKPTPFIRDTKVNLLDHYSKRKKNTAVLSRRFHREKI